VDERAVRGQISRVRARAEELKFADVANGRPVPLEAMRDVDLRTVESRAGP
jgi:hypothetical protein